MSDGKMPVVNLDSEDAFTHVRDFANRHRIKTLQDLTAFHFSELWQMEGYNLYVQNQVIDMARKYGIENLLKMD